MPDKKMRLADAYQLAQQVLEAIAPYCVQAEIAGSIRRRKDRVSDIEIVAIAQPGSSGVEFGNGMVAADKLDMFLKGLEANREITRHISADPRQTCWGPRHKKFLLAGSRGEWQPAMVDMYVVKPPAEWGAIYAIRTGPAEFGHAIMSKVLPRRKLRHENGRLLTMDGIPLATPTEREYFAALGLPYLRPDKRSTAVINWCVAQGIEPYEYTGPAVPVQSALF